MLPNIPDAAFLIIGDGPERQAIIDAAQRKGMSDRVILTGRVSDEIVRRAYAVADLFVMPNIPVRGDAEGFGLVALEAAAAGLPVVASHLEGIPDAVIPNETGILVPPLDATAWSTTITRLLHDSITREQLSNRAPKAVREYFSWEQRASGALITLQNLLKAEHEISA
ncbi:MAG: group 1 glycosyl transferase [Parcubacteria group bacterium Gr01-1014_106]|nr:MAG: group 1 glycosyl transferase [Parcubacteria group bacterium Gr01-1014_106]